MKQGRISISIKTEKDGSDASLKGMSLQASKALQVFLNSFIQIAEQYKGDDLKIEIREGSAEVAMIGNTTRIKKVKEDYDSVMKGESTNRALVNPWGKVQHILKSNGLGYEAYCYTDTQTRIDLLDNLIKSEKISLKESDKVNYTQIFLQGKLQRIGGNKPSFRFLPKTKTTQIIIRCTQNEAKRIDDFLYSDISLCIWVKEQPGKKPKYTFCDFYLRQLDFDYFAEVLKKYRAEQNSISKLESIHLQFRKLMQRDKNYTPNVIKFLRLFNHDSIDEGTLKTLLVLTKSFQSNEKINVVRKKIKRRLEEKMGPLY